MEWNDEILILLNHIIIDRCLRFRFRVRRLLPLPLVLRYVSRCNSNFDGSRCWMVCHITHDKQPRTQRTEKYPNYHGWKHKTVHTRTKTALQLQSTTSAAGPPPPSSSSFINHDTTAVFIFIMQQNYRYHPCANNPPFLLYGFSCVVSYIKLFISWCSIITQPHWKRYSQ